MNTSSYYTSKIGAFSVNARSLLPKIDELRALTLVHKPHLICIVESWLDSQILNSEICSDNYHIVRHDRNRQGGGVLIFIISSFSHNVLFSGPSELEFIILSINSLSSPITVGFFTVLLVHLSVFLIHYFIVFVCMLMCLFCPILFWWEISMLI